MILNPALTGLRFTVRAGELVADDPVAPRRAEEFDEATVRGLLSTSGITLANRSNWLGATVIGLRAPSLDHIMIRFDEVEAFNRAGGRNPFRLPGAPDWRFNWTVHHKAAALESFAATQTFFAPDPRCRTSRAGTGAYGLRQWRDQGFPADVLPLTATSHGQPSGDQSSPIYLQPDRLKVREEYRQQDRVRVLLQERFGHDIGWKDGQS